MNVVKVEVRRQGVLVFTGFVTRENIREVFEQARAAAETAVYDRLFDSKPKGDYHGPNRPRAGERD